MSVGLNLRTKLKQNRISKKLNPKYVGFIISGENHGKTCPIPVSDTDKTIGVYSLKHLALRQI